MVLAREFEILNFTQKKASLLAKIRIKYIFAHICFRQHSCVVLMLSTELHFSTEGVLLDGPYLKKIKI
ncbi:hypothetical protein T02_1858 [Trichinella nativa]|uniref:Uncharacterized protein n=1 Tax=Trichinella nativa TaxID=6335 RepID=A0A0V1LN09_9BILA|nr:hypothetical protein T02_1858 [Trichinella nativa]